MAATVNFLLWAGYGDGVSAAPQDALAIPLGPQATIDGTLSAGEWSAADSIRMVFEDALGRPVTADVWVMHDGEALQVAYRLDRADAEFGFAPELFLDTDNDRASTLRPDDWWLHLSASDCAVSGRYNDYATCTANADWETGPKPSARPVGTRAFEMRFPLSRLSLAAGGRFGLGICVQHATWVSGEWVVARAFWPEGGSPDRPATWRAAQLVAEGS